MIDLVDTHLGDLEQDLSKIIDILEDMNNA
jgi:hypothetical protein